jgi:hypothetical protein
MNTAAWTAALLLLGAAVVHPRRHESKAIGDPLPLTLPVFGIVGS